MGRPKFAAATFIKAALKYLERDRHVRGQNISLDIRVSSLLDDHWSPKFVPPRRVESRAKPAASCRRATARHARPLRRCSTSIEAQPSAA
jgi:hypothetical protein